MSVRTLLLSTMLPLALTSTWAQVTSDAATPVQFDTCQKVRTEDRQIPAGLTASVKYLASASNEIESAEIYRSSGDSEIDKRIVASIQTCRLSATADNQIPKNIEQFISVAVFSNGKLGRGDTPVILNARECAPKTEDYPYQSRQAGETGIAKIKGTINADGKLTSSEIIKTSRSRRLDAVSLSLVSECRFRAGRSIDGIGVGGTFIVDYRWSLD